MPWKAAWPGVEFVDVIAPDLYLCHGFGHTPGVYTGGWFRDVLLDMRAFAKEKNKSFGYGELGADSDDFATDVQMALADAEAFTGPAGGMVMWWNDWQVVDCRITGGSLPLIAEAYRKALTQPAR